ncbi:MAG: formamidopyrimidine-DNA glycosylase [Desulfobulbaceae bacterium BRH_c16a]|nr:MAG: formamidopyrimidine-DNA glycosylase [Desulfobulbaceae bacterium BRH_c16a]
MPELPEVEVICRGIRPHLIDRVITDVLHSGKSLRQRVPLGRMQRELLNRRVISVTRRAKFLMVGMESGAMLIIHLGMTGNLGFFNPSALPAKHDHVRWTLDNGLELRYNDSRRFGSVRILPPEEIIGIEEIIFKTTGPEPFSDAFSADYLYRLAKSREVAVKTFIMTNQVVAGVGNIYANESLFRAGIRPDRKVRSLRRNEWATLILAIRETLNHAIECGGSSISDFVNVSREKGYFQMNFQVYGKGRESCSTCGSAIEKNVIGGRASYCCPKCQR